MLQTVVEARLKHGMTQAAFAKFAGVKRGVIAHIEQDRTGTPREAKRIEASAATLHKAARMGFTVVPSEALKNLRANADAGIVLARALVSE